MDESTCALAIYEYKQQEDNEISFNEGDIITEIEEIDAGWWHGKINNKTGLFPANHVEKCV